MPLTDYYSVYNVTNCFHCPFFRSSQTLYCNHPKHTSEAEAHIIRRDDRGIPPLECPLHEGPTKQLIQLVK